MHQKLYSFQEEFYWEFYLLLLLYILQLRCENQYGKYKEDVNRESIVQFNQQYQKYSQKTLTYQDIASLINQAKNDNNKQEFPTTIKIYLNSKDGENLISKYTAEKWLSEKINTTELYSCEEVHINETTTLVDYIIIKVKK